MDTLVALAIAAIVGIFFVRGYLKSLKKQEEQARASAAKGTLFSDGPKSQHPHGAWVAADAPPSARRATCLP